MKKFNPTGSATQFLISIIVVLSVLFPFFLKAQVVTNGSLNGSPVGNNVVINAAGWTVCGFSPDLCNTTFASYVTGSQIPSSPSPDGGNWLGLAALGECAQTTITGLTPGNTYTLYFCGACFGTGTSIYNSAPAMPQVCVGATCQTYSFPMGPNWNSLSLTFTATAASMVLQAKAPTGNYYASLDGFNLVGPCSTPQIPIANFSASDTDFCTGTCISFTDLSTNNPTTWAWTFPGANTATSSAQNPTNICYNTAGTYTATLTASNGFGSSNFSRTIRVYAPAASMVNTSICSGDSVLINGIYRSTAGAYPDTLLTTHGCDSIITTNLSLLPVSTSNQNISICTGDSVLINGNYESTIGTYSTTYTSVNGCDSVATTNLSVLPASTNNQNVTICSDDSVLINGIYESTAGTYSDTLTSANGCDSIVAVNLAVLPTSSSTQNVSVCTGDSVLINGNYESTAGTYSSTFTSVNGCDSIATTNLALLAASSSTQNASICNGDSVLINGNYESTAGTYTVIYTASNGCDSVVTVNLAVLSTSSAIQNISICTGDSVLINGNYESTAGTYSSTFTSVNGCDSISTTTLSVISVSAINLGYDTTLCVGETLLLNVATPNASYLWQDNSTNADYTVTQQGMYWAQVDVSNCSKADTIQVDYETTNCNCFLFAPNVFTPNNDGNNDRFNAFANCTIFDIHITIFNRWGEKVFDTYNENGWDGTYQGHTAPAGVYVYRITYRLSRSNFTNIHGTVTLIR